MYDGFAQAWAGFSKNAHEGMATPRALPIWTVLLAGGQILPPLLVLAALAGLIPSGTLAPAAGAWFLSSATRTAITLAVRAPLATIALHPATVAVALAIQWNVLLRRERAGAATWKGRSYPVRGA
jgi:hypothetical protein